MIHVFYKYVLFGQNDSENGRDKDNDNGNDDGDN